MWAVSDKSSESSSSGKPTRIKILCGKWNSYRNRFMCERLVQIELCEKWNSTVIVLCVIDLCASVCVNNADELNLIPPDYKHSDDSDRKTVTSAA